MLGVGLHSYGFMDAAFWWLLIFVLTQVAVIALAQLPLDKWRSFQTKPPERRASTQRSPLQPEMPPEPPPMRGGNSSADWWVIRERVSSRSVLKVPQEEEVMVSSWEQVTTN